MAKLIADRENKDGSELTSNVKYTLRYSI